MSMLSGYENVNKNIILMSDGEDYCSDTYINQAITNDIKIYTLGFGSSSGDNTLQSIANRTGGKFFKAVTGDELEYLYYMLGILEGADCFIRWMRKCIWWQAGTFSFMPATFLGVLPIGLLLVKNGSLSPENFITSIILSAGLITPLVVAFSYSDDIAKMNTIFGEVTEILERDEMQRPNELTKKPQGSDICLNDVKFTYKDKEVLHGINMQIKQCKVNAIVGPSGSGKSTIARLIDSLWDTDSGSVTYGGVDNPS